NIEISTNSRIFEDILRNGIINIDVTTPSALFIKNVNPDSKYLLETRAKYINQKEFYGSDYFLKRIGYEDKWTRVRRLGDAYYENQLIERNIIEKLGTRFINGKELSIKELIDNGTDIAKKNALTIGQGLTKEQIAKLDKDIVWYEYQNVDGIQVLAPKVYLSQNTLKNLNSDSRTKIVGLDNTYIKTNKLENMALISGRGNTFIEADEVNNRTLGNQLAEISGENTQIIATNNINNIGARISAKQNLNLIAVNGDILNKSTVEKVEFNNGEFDRSKFTKIASVGEIISDGNLNIIANNYTSEGAVTQAKNANINVTNDVNISSQKVSGEQKFGKNDGQYNYYGFERNLGSVVKTKNLNVTAKNLNISGSVVTTQTADLNVDKLNIESKVDKEDEIKKSSYKDLLKSGSKKEIIHNEENSAGSLYVENKGTIKGDVNLVGSNLVLGDNSIINGKLTTDSNELHSSYSLEEKKKGFSSSIGSGGFSVGYGKSQSKLKEKDLTNAKSNLVLGDNVTLNKGAEITATNFTHGKVTVNNGDVKFGARKDIRDVETSSKSSGVNLSVRIKSEALDRAKQGVDSVNQLKSGDILGGLASTTNTVTGIVSGLASNQGTKLPTSAVNKNNSNDDDDDDDKNNQTNTVGKDNLKAAQANNNFYANIGVNLGFNKSSSKSNSHSESAVVTTIKGKDENSSITYNNVKNVEYVGTQAQDTKFIYNNVENINKTAVELNNSYSSTGKSTGISTGVTIGYGDGTQTEFNGVSISASKSNMNSNGTTYQNGSFVNVDEVHNNTKNMTLSGFNQEGGTVTGNIENLTIESKQNTSTTKGSTKGGSLSVSANGLPSGSVNYSKTNGERRVVDNASTFIIGDGSDLKVAKLENTAAAIGTTENGKLSIDEYEGHNLENVDKLKTAGGSVGVSTSGITSIGVNYSDKKQEGITKNTVIGNVEIEKSSGDEINRDLDTMTEITEDRDFKTNINVESQTINYIKNPEKFKEDLQKAKNEVEDLGNAVKNTSNPLGKDKRNVFSNLRAQRWSTSFYNVIGSRVEELGRQFKAGIINEEDLKEAVRDIVKGYGKDIGIDFDVVYLDEKTMPKDSEGSTGSSYIVDRKNRKVLIPIDVNKIEDIKKVLGTLTEEVAHGKDALEGRQDKKVAEDKSNDEEGLESLGRPANEYVKKKFGEDNNSKIKLTTDGIDLSNADVGEKVGDVLLKSEIDDAGGAKKVLHLETSEKITKIVGYRSNLEVFDKFLQGVTNKSLWSTVYDATPILGDIKGFHDGLTGKDSITDEKLSFFDRFIRGLPLIGRSVDTFQTINKPMKKGMDSLINLIIDFSKGSSKIDNVNDTTKLVRITEGIGDSSGVTKAVVKEIKVVDNSTDIAKTSKNLEKATGVSEDITKAVVKEVKVIDKSSDIAKNSENIIDSTKNTVETVNVLNKNKDLYYDGRKIYTAKEVNRMGKGADSVSKKGIEYILEPIPTKNINAQNFQSKTAGAKVITDNGVDKNLVPVLLYENRNKRGRNFIKFDGIEVEGGVTSLIDAKTDVPYWSKAGMEKIKGTLGRISEAKKQNPGIKVIYEFPNETAAGHLRSWIDKNNFYDGIVEIRVRK
ncbi:hemagglutinin repeat-containing protein, partial [Fusobacterium periodonticum]